MTVPPNQNGQPEYEPGSPEQWRYQQTPPQQPQPNVPQAGYQTPGRIVEPPPNQPPTELPHHYKPNFIAGMLACLGIAIGSLGPWLTVFNLSKAGVDNGGDGTLTLGLAALGAIALFTINSRGGKAKIGDRWVGPIVGAATVAVGITAMSNINDNRVEFMNSTIGPTIGWGLWAVVLSGAALCITSFTIAQIIGKR